ncbi:hypothetical protein SBC1_78620 (plasmid) [Caballeronia sp. SBC1]|nr:hypothetical protein SBC1_78620 [Caballeronia sp. SBC1]
MTCDHSSTNCMCPFAFTEASERVQNYGCLPTPHEIVTMRTEFGKTWACHDDTTKPCIGAIRHLKEHRLPHKVVDSDLLTDRSDWHLYASSTSEHTA